MTTRERTSFCPNCKKEQTRLFRKEEEVISQNFTDVCENKECPLYIEVEKVVNWQKIK